MALVTIPVESLLDGRRPPSETQARDWCARLEAGEILFFPQTPIGIAAGDLEFLLGQQQTDSSLHKNIAYKPMQDALSGVDTKTADAAAVMRLQLIMRWYSAAVEGFLATFSRRMRGAGSWITQVFVRRKSRVATWLCASATICCIPMPFLRGRRMGRGFCASSTTFIRPGRATGW